MTATPARQREVDAYVAEQHEISRRNVLACVAESVVAEARLEQAIAAAVAAGETETAARLRTALVIVTSARRGLVA